MRKARQQYKQIVAFKLRGEAIAMWVENENIERGYQRNLPVKRLWDRMRRSV